MIRQGGFVITGHAETTEGMEGGEACFIRKPFYTRGQIINSN